MSATDDDQAARKPHLIRRLYDWTLSWAERPGGIWALFLIALIESSVFPIPPDVLLLALCVGASRKSFQFALVCSIGSIIGGVIGYAIGFWGYEWIGEPIVNFYHGQEVMLKIKTWYDTYGFWGTLIAAITPIPFKIFTIASGAFKFPFVEFLLASVLGRTFRFFVVASLLWKFGPPIKLWVERYFDWCAWGFLILLIAGFAVLKFF